MPDLDATQEAMEHVHASDCNRADCHEADDNEADGNGADSDGPDAQATQSQAAVARSNVADVEPGAPRENIAEIYVTWDEGANHFAETTGPLSDERIAGYVRAYCPRLASGQIAEVGLAGMDWYERALGLLKAGWIMTVDYGFDAEMMYHPSRRTGTLRGFHRHELTTDPFQYIGEQDLTADVNFTALRDIGERNGWQTEFYGSQSRFLLQSGILERLADTMGRDLFSDPDQKRNRAIRQMVMPGGMGDHFKVLVQHRPPML